MTNGWYIYAVLATETPLPAGLCGFGDAALSTVAYRDVAAAVGPVDASELRPTEAHLLRHEEIVEAIRHAGPALPARFGTILSSREAVAQALADRYDILLADLARLGDKIEVSINILVDQTPDKNSESAEEQGEPRVIEAPSSSTGRGTRYLQERLAEHKRESSRQATGKAIAREVNLKLGHHTLDSRTVILPTARLALRITYLLEESELEDFRNSFDETRRALSHLTLLMTGPWPPYTFVTSNDGRSQLTKLGKLLDVDQSRQSLGSEIEQEKRERAGPLAQSETSHV